MTWLPKEPLTTPFWGLNVSLALKDEYFGYKLPETTTRERMLPVARLTKWIRTFGTINNGQEYINKIAKELGMRTMIGVYITNNIVQNKAQIEGLRKILQTGPAPDLIAVGNETILIGVNSNLFEACIDYVREMVLKQGFTIPIGSVELINASYRPAILQKLDFIGVNIYNGTWDATPENQMLDGVKQAYLNTVSTFPSKLILLTETGTPYAGNAYSVFDGTKQTPSKDKASNYLCEFLDWIKKEYIPAFYFEAYDEPAKPKDGGHPIEQYFGIMNGNLQIHPFYERCLPIPK
jgi:exo-beta-1,3-glucanase (GH17 family)